MGCRCPTLRAKRDGEPGGDEEQPFLGLAVTVAPKIDSGTLETQQDFEDTAEMEESIKKTLSPLDIFMRHKTVLILKGVQGIMFRALDTGLDFRTAVRFYMAGEVKWASLTLTFALVSPMLQCLFVYFKTQKCEVTLPFLIPGSMQHLRREWQHLLLVGALPQVALFQNIHTQAGAKYLNEVLAGIECLFESLPQALIQGYAYQVDGKADFLNYVSLSLSLAGVALGVVSAIQAMRKRAITPEVVYDKFGLQNDVQKNDASAAGDTLAMRSMHLSNAVVHALASFIQADGLITVFDLAKTDCTDSAVCVLTEACKGLSTVNLRACKKITDDGVTKLANNCKSLTKVVLTDCSNITDEGVTKLADNCKGLTEVVLTGCRKTTDEGVTKLADNCKGLTEVSLSGCPNITDEGVTKLADNCKSLTNVDLSGCPKITDDGVTKLADNCKGLTKVFLRECSNITDEGMTKLAENCKSLTKVYLNRCPKITDEGVTKLADNCKGLTEVSLLLCDITDEGVTKLADNCKSLTKVVLSGCAKVTDEGVAKLADNCKMIVTKPPKNKAGCEQAPTE